MKIRKIVIETTKIISSSFIMEKYTSAQYLHTYQKLQSLLQLRYVITIALVVRLQILIVQEGSIQGPSRTTKTAVFPHSHICHKKIIEGSKHIMRMSLQPKYTLNITIQRSEVSTILASCSFIHPKLVGAL